MSENIKIKRIPNTISGRSFSNGIMLCGGKHRSVVLRIKDGTLYTETSKIKNYNSNKHFGAFVNMIVLAVSGIVTSLKAIFITRSFSLIRLFRHHGAEHKVIHCYEDGAELTVENAKKYSTYHPRCGTGLAANVLIIEGLICLIVPQKLRNALCGVVDIILFFAALFAGFKLTRYAADKKGKLFDVIRLPGKLLQKVTALEPTEEMLECGIEAAKNIVQSEYK